MQKILIFVRIIVMNMKTLSSKIFILIIILVVCLSTSPLKAEAAPTAQSKTITAHTNIPQAFSIYLYDAEGGNLTVTASSITEHGGTLTMTSPSATATSTSYISFNYLSAPAFIGVDHFDYSVSNGVTNATGTITLNVSATTSETWIPPIGIPRPEFGIGEDYTMYNNVANRNPNLTYTSNGDGGFYTHYVDNTAQNCSDSTNGTSTSPRCLIPIDLPAGSIVEVHNGAGANGPSGEAIIGGVGSATMPIFIRGVNMPRVEHQMNVGFYINARYLIVEGISFWSGGTIARRSDVASGGEDFEVSYIAIRDCEFTGDITGGGFGIDKYPGNTNRISNIVLQNNSIHDNGDPTVMNQDHQIHAVTINGGNFTWVLENEMYRNEGNGVQINGGSMLNAQDNLYNAYVGRNIMHDNKQPGVGIKSVYNAIISQNEMYASDSSILGFQGRGQSCGGYQYGPERVWFIFNNCHDIASGFYGASADDPSLMPGQNNYFVGNLLYRIHHLSIFDLDDDTVGDNYEEMGTAIANYGGRNRHVVNNTIYDVDSGINTADTDPWFIENNIISKVAANLNRGNHIYLTGYNFELNNNIFYQNGDSNKIKIYSPVYDVPALQSTYPQAQLNMSVDPLFTDPEGGNFALSASTSEAVDNGTISDVYATFEDFYGISISKDFTGLARPQDGLWDIGAYEYNSGNPPQTTYRLSVNKTGTGTFSASYSNTTASFSTSKLFNTGTEVTITAIPGTGYSFTGWSNGCTGTGTCTLTMDQARSVSANFTANGAPISISSVASSTTNTTATITWTTNESATSTLNYGLTSGYSSSTSSSTATTSHSFTLTGLTPETTYHFQASSWDTNSNLATSSDYTFTTTTDTPAVVVTPPTTTNTGGSHGGGGGGTPPPTATTSLPTTSTFIRTLALNSTGNDVKTLQIFLNSKGYTISTTGPGSKGKETTYFGPATSLALKKLQTSAKLPATGILDEATRKYLNTQYSTITGTITLSPDKVAILASLQKQLNQLLILLQEAMIREGKTATTPQTFVPQNSGGQASPQSSTLLFPKNLWVNMQDPDIKRLQVYLNSKGFVIATEGPGSLGNESDRFGNATIAALKKYQASIGVPQSGMLDEATRAKTF